MKRSIYNIIKNYSIRSLFIKYWLIIYLIILIPCLALSYVKSASDIRRTKDETANTALLSIENIRNNFESVLASANSQWVSLSLDNYVQIYLSKKEFENNLTASRVYTHIYNIANNFIVSNSYIDSIYIYNPENQHVFSTSGSNYIDNFYDINWYELWKTHGEGIYYRNEKILKNNVSYLSICKNINYKSTVDGVLVTNICTDALTKMLATKNANTLFYIAEEDGNIIFSNVTEAINSSIFDEKQLSEVSFEGLSDAKVTNKNKVFCRIISEDTGLSFYSVIDLSESNPFFSEYFSLALFIILILFLSLCLSFLITKNIYSSFLQIIDVLQNPYSNASADNKNSFNELQFITQNIINVFNKNKQIEKELACKLELLKNSQTIALYTQINPHFLFNTLQMISTLEMAAYKKDTGTTRIISLLSDILYTTLDTTTFLVPLETEINYLKKYGEILNIRYDNKFSITFDIAEDTLSLNVVKFSLQPILENSVKHGILPLRKDGKINVSSYTKGNNLIIEIFDNGGQIPIKKLVSIHSLLANDTLPEKNSIGLLNVHHRIKLIFGDEYGCDISSNEKGTTVTLTMKKTSAVK